MNGDEIKWLEKLFAQHKEEQQLYLDTKFNFLENKIEEIKDISASASKAIIESERQCAACKTKIQKDTTKKVVAGGVITFISTITLWAAFGADAVKYLLGLIGRIF